MSQYPVVFNVDDGAAPAPHEGQVVVVEMCQTCYAAVPSGPPLTMHYYEQHQIGSPPSIEGPPVATPV